MSGAGRDGKGAREWIERLGLQEHPEGGFYREVFRSEMRGSVAGFAEEREIGTSIYFLITEEAPSRLHRLRGEEIWHWHAGSPLSLHLIDPVDRTYEQRHLNSLPGGPGEPQCVVPAGVWFGATVESGYALVGCTVLPGFRFEDFEMGERDELLRAFPDHAAIIRSLTAG